MKVKITFKSWNVINL